ncbi:MAG: triose-phosphate isomerase [Candidatus Cloacimonetes bacterium]|nr:triose-phosphate isomerase [Candidatus Cloacimonadota bacterium]
MKRLVIAGNWKMHKSFEETDDFIEALSEFIDGIRDRLDKVDVIVCPSFVYLEMATDFADEREFFVGAQDVSRHEKGAYTGEISAAMLESLEVDFCIVGHSERRKFHAETDEAVNARIKVLQERKIIPIVCIGETEDQRTDGQTIDVLRAQLEGCFAGIDAEQGFLVAYEPVWAIGTGKTATPAQAQEAHAFIRGWLTERYDANIAASVPILYGGSVNPGNIDELMSQADIGGALIGGASLDIGKFKTMIEAAIKLTK